MAKIKREVVRYIHQQMENRDWQNITAAVQEVCRDCPIHSEPQDIVDEACTHCPFCGLAMSAATIVAMQKAATRRHKQK